ncbi:MAG TPA: hypothetical protein VKD72_04210, partial [Gemmataceae bacterium]|nr:hypothetical protein [Gemmataceae bacterium]
LSFATQWAQGVYNAAVALLGGKKLLDYAHPGEKIGKDGVYRPPLWISAVGSNGLWPLAVVELGENDRTASTGSYTEYVYPGKLAGDSELPEDRISALPVSWLWFSVAVGMALLCAGLAYRAWDYARSGRAAAPPPVGAVSAGAASSGTTPAPGEKFRAFVRGADAVVERWWPFTREATLSGICLSLCLGVIGLFAWFASGLFRPSAGHWLYGLLSTGALIAATLVLTSVVASGGFLVGRRAAAAAGRTHIHLAGAMVAILLAAVAAVLSVWLWHNSFGAEGTKPYLFERSVVLTSGLSPALPAFFLTLALGCCCLCVLKRLYLLRSFSVDNPLPPGSSNDPRLLRLDLAYQRAREVLEQPLCTGGGDAWKGLVLLVFLLVALWRLCDRVIPSFEQGWAFDVVLRLGFAVVALAALCGLFRLHVLWARTKELLHELAVLPLVAAYSRLPEKVSTLFGRYLMPQRPRRSHLVLPLHQWGLIVEGYGKIRERLREALPDPTALAEFEKVKEDYRPDLLDSGPADGVDFATNPAQAHLQRAARACVLILQPLWPQVSVTDAYGYAGNEPKPGEYPVRLPPARISDPPPDEDVKRWLRMLEDFVAMQSVPFLCQFFAPLRNLVNFLLLVPLLLLLAVASYPFQPQRLLLVFLITLLLLAVVQVVTVLIQMDRDEVLSRISRTTPNRVTFDLPFLTSLLTYTAPVLAIVMAVFGEVGGLVGSWFEPIARTLK